MQAYFLLLLNVIAARTPGNHPAQVKSVVITIAPQPQSKTASGGKIMHNSALPHPILKTPHRNSNKSIDYIDDGWVYNICLCIGKYY